LLSKKQVIHFTSPICALIVQVLAYAKPTLLPIDGHYFFSALPHTSTSSLIALMHNYAAKVAPKSTNLSISIYSPPTVPSYEPNAHSKHLNNLLT
jgi:hypothetical protein